MLVIHIQNTSIFYIAVYTSIYSEQSLSYQNIPRPARSPPPLLQRPGYWWPGRDQCSLIWTLYYPQSPLDCTHIQHSIVALFEHVLYCNNVILHFFYDKNNYDKWIHVDGYNLETFVWSKQSVKDCKGCLYTIYFKMF